MKKIIILLMLVSLVVLSGCGKKYYDNDIKKADTNIIQVAAQRK